MTVLVLGATGLVGSHARTELERRGFETVGTSTTGDGADLAVELTDRDGVEALIAGIRPELVIQAAGISSLGEAWEHPDRAFGVNTTGVFNLLEALRRHTPASHLTFTSTAAVYGPPKAGQGPFAESSPIQPTSPYAASKAAAETLCGQYEREYGLGVTVARLFNQIGPGQSASQAPSEFAMRIAHAERHGQREVDLPVGNPEAERDFTDVRDTARAIADLTTARVTGTFNVCSGEATSLREIVRLLGEATGLEASVVDKPGHHRPADVPRITGSAAKLKGATGWEPEFSLGESLALLLDDWRADRIRPHDD